MFLPSNLWTAKRISTKFIMHVIPQQIFYIPTINPLSQSYSVYNTIFIINTFAASYLNTQGLNNSYLKSPASTLVDLNFNRARSALSA